MEQTGREEIFGCSVAESGTGGRKGREFSLFGVSGAAQGSQQRGTGCVFMSPVHPKRFILLCFRIYS